MADELEVLITPIFKTIELENVPKSEAAGYPVMELHEVVEVRFAGDKNYSPVFPATAFAYSEAGQTVTYAERWPEQYARFKEGNPQEAMGTPLQMLAKFGITPELMSMCKALKIYSVEQLYNLQGQKLKSLGIHTNKLREAAKAFMAERQSAAGVMDEIEALKAEIARLKGEGEMTPPVTAPTPDEVEQAVAKADAKAYADMTDAQIKDRIALLNEGKRPAGNPSRNTLEQMLEGLEQAA